MFVEQHTHKQNSIERSFPQASHLGRGEWVGNETILLVDDEELVLAYLTKALIRFGYKVLTASDPEEALVVFRNNQDRINLVVLDVIMPGMNGAQLLKKIHAIQSSTPALIISAFSEQDIEKLFPDGLNKLTFLQKPFVPGDLLSRLRILLDGKQGLIN